MVALERRRMPSDKDLARMLGVSTRAVQYAMSELLRVCEVSRETNSGNIADYERIPVSASREAFQAGPVWQSRRQTEERAQSIDNRFLECTR